MAVLPEYLSNCTVFLLAKAYQKAHGRFKRLLQPHGLTNIQYLVLVCAAWEPGLTAAEIGKMLILDKATLSGVIDRLTEAGWIERQKDAEDQRIQRLYATKKTKAVLEALVDAPELLDQALLAHLSLEEKLLLKRLLKDLL